MAGGTISSPAEKTPRQLQEDPDILPVQKSPTVRQQLSKYSYQSSKLPLPTQLDQPLNLKNTP